MDCIYKFYFSYSLLLFLLFQYILFLLLNNKTLFVPLKVPDDNTRQYISYNPLSNICTNHCCLRVCPLLKGLAKVASSKNRAVLKNIFTSIKRSKKFFQVAVPPNSPKWDFQSINAMKNHNHFIVETKKDAKQYLYILLYDNNLSNPKRPQSDMAMAGPSFRITLCSRIQRSVYLLPFSSKERQNSMI